MARTTTTFTDAQATTLIIGGSLTSAVAIVFDSAVLPVACLSFVLGVCIGLAVAKRAPPMQNTQPEHS